MMGMNVITLSDVAFLADYEPDLGILFGPYLTDDQKQSHKNVLNRVLMDSQGGKYESFTKFTPQCD